MQITTKTQMYDLLSNGTFGNRFRIWNTAEEMLEAVDNGFDWLVGLRCVGQPGLPYVHHLEPAQAIRLSIPLQETYQCGIRFYEASPDQFITIQGEITDYPHGYGVEWSHQKTHMREALSLQRFCDFSPRIPAIIRHHFNEPSYNDLIYLFDTYPNCTIEFTCYEILVGDLPGRNTVILECRHY